MDATICYSTGTGNSLWVARTLAQELGNAGLLSIADWDIDRKPIDSGCIGIVFPVYIWGVPARIVRFTEELAATKPDCIFAVAVNGGQVANTLVQLDLLLKKGGMSLASGWEITMPSNYIPWGGPGPKEKQYACFEAAKSKITTITHAIVNNNKKTIDKGPFWQSIVFSFLHRITFSHVPKMDKHFWVDDKCNHCGICGKVCPSGNIEMKDGKPVWHHKCEQCLACLQWCPKESIQYGKKTPGYERYHHPEIHITDILKNRAAE